MLYFESESEMNALIKEMNFSKEDYEKLLKIYSYFCWYGSFTSCAKSESMPDFLGWLQMQLGDK